MRQAKAIGDRLCVFICAFAKRKGLPEFDCARDYFGLNATQYKNLKSGDMLPSLLTCELAVKRGCHPRYLFLGDKDIPGDPIKCFSLRYGNRCRALDVHECNGYSKCRFYQSEQSYLAKCQELSQ